MDETSPEPCLQVVELLKSL
ncbi:hypothetical protein RSAG8_12192, partial [Rhizoctonia solani AG-8 WAC10335]